MLVVCTYVRPSRKLNLGYNFAISYYFFMKLSNYIAYDKTDMKMPNILGRDYICQSFAPFGWILSTFCDKVSEGNTSVELNTYVVLLTEQPLKQLSIFENLL